MISWRNVGSGRSNATTMPAGLWSLSRLMSIDVNPNTAFVTWPDAVAMSVGRAKKARYASEFPSSSMILAIGPSLPAGPLTLRVQVAGDDALGDHAQGDPFAHGRGPDPAEGVRFLEPVLVHEDALGPVDVTAGGQLVLEAGHILL